MKILFVSGHYWPHSGGVEKYVQELSQHLNKKGLECRVLTNNTNRVQKEEIIKDIKITRLPCFNIIQKQFPITLPFLCLFKTLKNIRTWKPDYIITNTRYFTINYIIAFYNNIFLKSKRIHIEHGSDFVQLGNPFLNYLAKIYDKIFGKYVLKKTIYRAGVSKKVNTFLEREFKINTNPPLYNSVSEKIYTTGKSFKEDLNLPTETIIVGFASRLIPEKGIKLLVDVFKKIKKDRNIFLLVAGAGPLEGWMKQESLHEGIHFLGRLDHEEMKKFFRTIDILTLPSYYPEGLPTIILESGLYQKLVIATPRGGTEEVIKNNTLGKIIKEKDRDDLEKALIEYIDNYNENKEIGRALQNLILKEFTWDIATEKLISIFNEK